MSKLQYLVIHCLATPEGREVTRKDIEKWHLKERGWKKVGYSDFIHINGRLENLIPYNEDDEVDVWEISNGASGYNSISRHVAYVGGKDVKGKTKDTRTDSQKKTLKEYVEYFLCNHPKAKVIGHNQISNKDCPSFSVPDWLRSIGVDKRHIL